MSSVVCCCHKLLTVVLWCNMQYALLFQICYGLSSVVLFKNYHSLMLLFVVLFLFCVPLLFSCNVLCSPVLFRLINCEKYSMLPRLLGIGSITRSCRVRMHIFRSGTCVLCTVFLHVMLHVHGVWCACMWDMEMFLHFSGYKRMSSLFVWVLIWVRMCVGFSFFCLILI